LIVLGNIKGGISMPKKTVFVQASLKENFRVDCQAGTHKMVIDQPQAGGGNNDGPSPLDYILMALAGCIATIGRIVAKQRRIDLKGIEVEVEGDLNTDFLMGTTDEGRPGFTEFRVNVTVDAPISDKEKEEFIHEVDRRCPISDNIVNDSKIVFNVK